jgi:hypothetical protein
MASGSIQMNGTADFTLTLTVTETATNAAANTSDVSYSLVINPPGTWEAYNLTSSNQSYSITINGSVVASGGFTYDFRSPNNNTNKTVKSGTVSGIAHTADGSKTIAAFASANTANSGIGDGTIASFNTILTDFVRLPSAPAAPSLSRASDGVTLTITSAVADSPVTVTDYNFRVSTDGSSWSADLAMGSDRTETFDGTPTSGYYVATRAYSSEGWGPYSASAFIAGLPSAPASISAVRSGRDVLVVTGGSASNGGATITDYQVQYSTNAGSSWSTAVSLLSGSYNFTSLTPALTYLFRVYAVNSIGNSAATTSGAVFVPAGGKRWDGSAFTATSTVKRWDGSTWADVLNAKRWNGSAWEDLS